MEGEEKEELAWPCVGMQDLRDCAFVFKAPVYVVFACSSLYTNKHVPWSLFISFTYF